MKLLRIRTVQLFFNFCSKYRSHAQTLRWLKIYLAEFLAEIGKKLNSSNFQPFQNQIRLSPCVIKLDDFLSHLKATGVAATPVQVEVDSNIIFTSLREVPMHDFLTKIDLKIVIYNRQTTHTHQLERRPDDKLPGNHVTHKLCVI